MLFFRKLYIRIRMFFKTYRDATNGIIITLMLSVLAAMFINAVLFERIIVPYANSLLISGKYQKSISYFNIAETYYKFFHANGVNKEIYFEIPYKKAQCYSYLKNSSRANGSLLLGITNIQKEYGIFSHESAWFIRKYLINYYIKNHNIKLALAEYDNLLAIYRKIGYTDNEVSDLIRICGDIYYAQGKYDSSINYYEKAYAALEKSKVIDDTTFAETAMRIANYNIQNKKFDVADKIYTSATEVLKAQKSSDSKYIATILLEQGSLNHKQNKIADATKNYEEAVKIIEKLPKTTFLHQNLDLYYGELKKLYDEGGQFHKTEEVQIKIDRRRRLGIFA